MTEYTASNLIPDGLLNTETYTETVLEVRGNLRLVVCRKEGVIQMYRVETLPGVTPYAHKVAYWQEKANSLLNGIDTWSIYS